MRSQSFLIWCIRSDTYTLELFPPVHLFSNFYHSKWLLWFHGSQFVELWKLLIKIQHILFTKDEFTVAVILIYVAHLPPWLDSCDLSLASKHWSDPEVVESCGLNWYNWWDYGVPPPAKVTSTNSAALAAWPCITQFPKWCQGLNAK